MHYVEILKRLCREKREWLKSETLGHEVKWIVRGIDQSIRQVHALYLEQAHKHVDQRHDIPVSFSGELYQAVKMALIHLGRGDRAKAIDKLQSIKDKAETLGGQHGHSRQYRH